MKKKINPFYYNLYVNKRFMEYDVIKCKQLCFSFKKERDCKMLETLLNRVIEDLDVNSLSVSSIRLPLREYDGGKEDE